MNYLRTLILLPFFCGPSIYASNAGEEEFAFLNSIYSTFHRSVSKAGGAAVFGPNSTHLNPAGHFKADDHQITSAAFHYSAFEIATYSIQHSLKKDSLPISFQFVYQDIGTIEEYDSENNPTGNSHSPFRLIPSISSAIKIQDDLLLGATFKLPGEKLSNESNYALGWAFDIGVLQVLSRQWTVGFSIIHFGRKEVAHVDNGSNHNWLNVTGRASSSYRLKRIYWYLDFEKGYYSPFLIQNGLSYSIYKFFQIHAGFSTSFKRVRYYTQKLYESVEEEIFETENLISGGFSFERKNLKLEYAAQLFGGGIGLEHQLQLSLQY